MKFAIFPACRLPPAACGFNVVVCLGAKRFLIRLTCSPLLATTWCYSNARTSSWRQILYEQIISIACIAEAVTSSHKHIISDANFCAWRKTFNGLALPEVKRLKKREPVSGSDLQKWCLSEDALQVVEPIILTTDRKREAVAVRCEVMSLSRPRACTYADLFLSTCCHEKQPPVADAHFLGRTIALPSERRRFC